MSDPHARLERLRRKRDDEADADARADLDEAIAALEEKIKAAGANLQPPGRVATNTGQLSFLNLGDIKGNVFINGRRGQEPSKLIEAYLRRLAGHCAILPLQGIREQRAATDTFNLSLDEVYTQLATTAQVRREALRGPELAALDVEGFLAAHTGSDLLPFQQRLEAYVRERAEPTPSGRGRPKLHQTRAGRAKQQPQSAAPEVMPQAFPLGNTDAAELQSMIERADEISFNGPQLVTEAIAFERLLVLLGEPGSGKSTALRYLALTLARAGLDEHFNPASQLEGWETLGENGRLLPLFLPLLPFARTLADETRKPAGADELWNYIRERLEDGGRHTGLAEAVHEELERGNVLLMLDGLDEVAGEASRRQVVRAVQAFAKEYAQCRIVVSCRVRAYNGEANSQWRLAGWPVATLADWVPAQMRHFVVAWYRAAAAATGIGDEKREERAESLRRAITVRDDLRRLGIRPLLMTIMALVHFNDQGQLPQERVALYSRCVDILLGQWELAREDGSEYGALMDFIELPDVDVKILRPLLEQAAYKAHLASSKDSPGALGAATLRDMVAQFLDERKHPNAYRGARRFLEYTDKRAGLLQASDAADAYVFPHLTFQEYLAGRELVSGVGVVERIWQHRDDDRWRVPILLGVGDHVTDGKLEMPLALLMRLTHEEGREPAEEGRDLLLAAEIAEDVGWASLERGGVAFKRLRSELATALGKVVEGMALPATERVRAGVFLGELGDSRRGVCDFPPLMVPFAGGTFVIGEPKGNEGYDDEINDQPVTLPGFELARYPVTNAQYQLFIAAGGYKQSSSWWSEAGHTWLKESEAREPEYWRNLPLGVDRPNHPVVGVSWYEAMAFCAWLTRHLNDGYTYCLPSEAEWEYAARGVERRTYPWGPEAPDSERANFGGTHNGTTAVGCFPEGATPEGLLDMAGNVWEWTRSVYRPYPYDPTDGREDEHEPENKRFTLRGGSWAYDPFDLRAAYRYRFAPALRGGDLGFRLARRLPHVKG